MDEEILNNEEEETEEDVPNICDCNECEDCIKRKGECTCGDCEACLSETPEDEDDSYDDLEPEDLL